MKLNLILLSLCTSYTFATSYSQTARVNVKVEKGTIVDIFNQVESQSEYRIFYRADEIDLQKKYSVEYNDESVGEMLSDLLKESGSTIELVDKIIVISGTKQQATITGTVSDASTGEPLTGAYVRIDGSNTGGITDANGKYSVTVPGKQAILIFSSVGYVTESVPVEGKTVIDIALNPDILALEEIVVVGYGTQRKKDVTSATSTIKSDIIVSRPIVRVEQALQGTIPGVSVTSQNGQPGQSIMVRVRGVNSITGGLDPLYVIDGFIGASINGVAPEDIESIDVLKDASATAIYGSRGSNGVVLVTTKSGKEGKMKVNFSSWISQSQMFRYVDVMNAYDFADTRNRIDVIKNLPKTFSQAQLDAFSQPGATTDWQKEISRTALTQNYQADVSGGTGNVKYLISGSYLNQEGVIINSWYKRYSLRANVDIKANEKLDFKINILGFQTQGRNNQQSSGFYTPFGTAQTFNPTLPVKNEEGLYNMSSPYGNGQFNPVAEQNNNIQDNNQFNVQVLGLLNYHIIKNLTFTTSVGYQHQSSMDNSISGPETGAFILGTDGIGAGNAKYWSFQNSNYLTYNLNSGDHALTITALYEQSMQESQNNWASDRQLPGYGNGYYLMGIGKQSTVGSGYWGDALQSFMGRVNYAYKDKYLATISLRDDGSSHLTEKYSLFPSVSLGWNIVKEDFLLDAQVLSTLKLRASYGKTGNQAVGAYSTIPALVSNGFYYFNAGQQSAVQLGNVVSESLKWETTNQANVGLDVAFFKNRLTFNADVYTKKINDLLYDYPAPDYLGAIHGDLQKNATYVTNLGTLDVKGLELSIGGTPVDGSAFKWNSSLNLSFSRNEVADMGGLDSVLISGTQNQEAASILKVGMATGQFYGYKFIGTWKTEEAAEALPFGGIPGSSKFEDLNHDGKLSEKDRTIIGHGQPKFTFGFNNNFSYRNFSLNIFFQGSQGNQIYSFSAAELNGGLGIAKDAASPDVKNNMWTPDKQTDFPVPGHPKDFTLSDRYVFDGSYVKLKNLSLSYRLPESILKSIKMNGLEVYVSGQNILTITNYKGYDPETTWGTNALLQGLESGSIPNPKTYTVGLRASF